MNYRTEADLVMALRELHSADERRARYELSRELVRVRSRARTRPNMGLAGIALLGIAGLALALLLPSFHTGSGASSMASAVAAPSRTTTESSSLASTLAEPSASSSETPFPSTVEGRDVLNGQAALSQMLASPSDWYFVSGWVRIVMVDGYSYSGTNVLFFLTDPESASSTSASIVRLEGPDVLQLPQNRRIVLEVQPDLSCTVQQGSCPVLMVKRVVWTQS
jgi:hypothetical protein